MTKLNLSLNHKNVLKLKDGFLDSLLIFIARSLIVNLTKDVNSKSIGKCDIPIARTLITKIKRLSQTGYRGNTRGEHQVPEGSFGSTGEMDKIRFEPILKAL